MKQSLQLKLGQQLTMTPQLQQAIRLLQLSTLDLQQEIQEALESNPMLEEGDDSSETTNAETASTNENTEQKNDIQADESPDLDTPDFDTSSFDTKELAGDDNWSDKIPDDLPLDTNWQDVYQSSAPSSMASNVDRPDFDIRSNTESLQDHLLWQLNLASLSEIDHMIAVVIIDAIDNDGFLTSSLEDIHISCETNDYELELDEVEAVLHRVQQFDPAGVAATSLQDSLSLQLQQLSSSTPWLQQAQLVVTDHLALLANRDYNQLMRATKLKEPELRDVIQLIQSLNPRPGSIIEPTPPEYVIPDVLVYKKNDQWKVELNPDTTSKLRVNSGYASLVKRADNGHDNTYLRNNLQEARWFIKSIQNRNETLLKVASCIVERQEDFLNEGDEAMKPLVLHDIAEAVDMHESTISRVTTQKYMHTPLGIFELKYFFSSHVSTDSGGECSSTAIRAMIKKLVSAEQPQKPLSDNKIANVLAEQGIKVARRTVAKYRESMLIPPSNERKRLM